MKIGAIDNLRVFLVYNCRDADSQYLGRFIITSEDGFSPSILEVNNFIHSHGHFKNTVTWSIKEADTSLLMDFIEYGDKDEV